MEYPRQKQNKLKVGILADSFMGWSGGVDFLSYITNALISNGYHAIVLFSQTGEVANICIEGPDDVKGSSNLNEILFGKLKRHSHPDKTRKNEYLASLEGHVTVRYFSPNAKGLIRVIDRYKIDVVLPAMSSLGSQFPTPWVGYIWDFQHVYYPDLFDEENILHRKNLFGKTLEDAPSIIVNARTIKKDAARIYGKKYNNKIHALPFMPYPKKEWLSNLDHLQKKYKLPRNYFVISNQYWQHKDHMTAIEALGILVNQMGLKNIKFVSTGKMEDSRNPKYIQELRNKISSLGLAKNFINVGFLPKLDQIAIIKNSKGLVQPTLYEGGPGGGATYNALALNIPVYLSDIPINKEIKDPRVIYFEAGSAESLAKAILKKRKHYTGPNKYKSDALIDVLHTAITGAISGRSEP